MSDSQFAALLGIGSVVLPILGFLIHNFLSNRRLNVARAKLSQYGDMFCHNQNNGVMAICTRSDFNKELGRWKDGKEPWRRTRVQVVPTFTFFGEDYNERLVNTGTKKDLELTLNEYICKITGLNTSKIPKRDLESLYTAVSVLEERLYVPYSVDKSAEADYKVFKVTSLKDFRKLLLG